MYEITTMYFNLQFHGIGLGKFEVWVSLNQFKRLQGWRLHENGVYIVATNQFSRWWNLWMTGTSFWTHTQRRKLKFLETALSLQFKVNFSTFVCNSLCQVMTDIAQGLHVWLLWRVILHSAASAKASVLTRCKPWTRCTAHRTVESIYRTVIPVSNKIGIV